MRRLAALALAAAAALTAPSHSLAEAPPLTALPGLYPEGPVVIDGDLFVAEMTGDRVSRIIADPEAKGGLRREIFFKRKGCGPTALAEISERRIAVLCHLEGGVAIVDHSGALLEVIGESDDGVRLDSPNDIASDGAGGAFFSNAGQFHPKAPRRGRLMRLAPDLTVTTVAQGLFYANGVAVDHAAGRVLVSEHLARQVLSYPLTQDYSRLGAPRTLIDFKQIGGLFPLDDALTGPDGIEIAPDGSVLVAIYGGGGFLRRDRNGVMTRHAAGTRFLCSLAVWRGRLALTGAHRNDLPPFKGLIEIVNPPD